MGDRRLQVTYRRAADLVPYERNARTHSARQIEQIAASIRRFGFTNPLLVDSAGRMIAGHGRLAAARTLQLLEVPTICIDGLSDEERRALVLADNRIAESSGWDEDMLRAELGALKLAQFDMAVLGFTDKELAEFSADGVGGGANRSRCYPDRRSEGAVADW